MKNICILGDGLLGKELRRQTDWDYISRKRDGFDITDRKTWTIDLLINQYHGVAFVPKYNVLINCMACTDTYSEDRDEHWKTNYEGVVTLTDYCALNKIKLVHISTDYVYSNSVSNASEDDVPVHCANWYGYTKLLGDAYVQLKSKNNLVIRATHKPKPFPYHYAWITQTGNFDYVDIISDKIIRLIEHEAIGVYNVGTEQKSMFELAKETNDDVIASYSFTHETTPKDISMNIDKLKRNLAWLDVS